jgi:hypothetical protein
MKIPVQVASGFFVYYDFPVVQNTTGFLRVSA